jgi:hypothetical protein
VPNEVVPADITYETLYHTTDSRLDLAIMVKLTNVRDALTASMLGWQSQQGAAARSPLRDTAKLRPAVSRKVDVTAPRYKVVDAETLQPAAGVALDTATASSISLTRQAVRASGKGTGVQVVESFEVVA